MKTMLILTKKIFILLAIALALLLAVLLQKNEFIVRGAEMIYPIVKVSAYTSSLDETDATPCLTASMTNICPPNRQICASNKHKFGTLLKVGDIVCEVQDRMNRRYTDEIDLLMATKREALNFGVKYLPLREF